MPQPAKSSSVTVTPQRRGGASGNAATPPVVSLGQRLRELRSRQRLSLGALAEKSGFTAHTLSLIENDQSSPSVASLQPAAAALGVPITAFFETSADTQRAILHAGQSGHLRGGGHAGPKTH